jgi:8-oxo-dGTP diphosphatase
VVAAALRRDDGRWLLHRRPLPKQHGGLWEFPGGKVEEHESLASALVRELREELGIVLDTHSIQPLAFAQDWSSNDIRGLVILLYSVGSWSGQPRALEDGAAIGWFMPHEIVTLERPPLDVALCAQIFTSQCDESRPG